MVAADPNRPALGLGHEYLAGRPRAHRRREPKSPNVNWTSARSSRSSSPCGAAGPAPAGLPRLCRRAPSTILPSQPSHPDRRRPGPRVDTIPTQPSNHPPSHELPKHHTRLPSRIRSPAAPRSDPRIAPSPTSPRSATPACLATSEAPPPRLAASQASCRASTASKAPRPPAFLPSASRGFEITYISSMIVKTFLLYRVEKYS